MLAEIESFIQWIRMHSPQAKTWRDYKCDLKIFITVVGDHNIGEIYPRHIDDFVNSQIRQGYKPSTINRRLAAIVSFHRFLILAGKVLSCPVLARRHYLREPERLPRPVNEEELRKFFQAIEDTRDRAMFTLMLRCGLRIGEVSALQMNDLYLGEAPSRLIIRGKGARERTVYLSREAEKHLHGWLAERPKARDEHVFLSYQHKKLSTTSISTRVRYVCSLSGVNLTAHRLRHSFADHLLSAGMPITSIQMLMGHRFVETTQNYATANDKQVQSDFYSACEQLDGWKLLLETVQEDVPQEEQDFAYATDVEPVFVEVAIPERVSQLPIRLAQQLEAYHRLQVNRWRVERVAANSVLFFSKHCILWEFFCNMCAIEVVSDLRLEHVLKFVKVRLDDGRSAQTINGSLSSLRSFLLYLKEDGVSIHQSLDNIQRLKEAERLPRYITSDQVQRLKLEMEGKSQKTGSSQEHYDALLLRAIFYLLWQGGLRSGEVELLRFSDFYISKANLAKRLFVRDGKWRKGRVVYLTDVSLHAFREYLAVRGTKKMEDFVFIRKGMPLRKNFLGQRLKCIGRQVGVSVSPHRLRHTFATQLLNVGCKVTSIQKLLGHTNLNTTMTYARAFDQTIMQDYFHAVEIMESQPEGAWIGLNSPSLSE